ncbi:hypothetical protein FAIPA1_380042 [Frankia sp. AiPs1]
MTVDQPHQQRRRHRHTVPPALRPIVLLAQMREYLPPAHLASLLATFTPPLDPTEPVWTRLCSALDSYGHAARLGLSLDEARARVDDAATILLPRYGRAHPTPQAAESGRPRDGRRVVVSVGIPRGLARVNRWTLRRRKDGTSAHRFRSSTRR